MLYVTFNDAPSGIYFSQVTDVCKFLKQQVSVPNVKLIAFISIRSFWTKRALIRTELPGAIVIPMFPTMRLWKFNLLTLSILTIFFNGSRIIARGPYACWLALSLRKFRYTPTVVFDARGAYAAELNEYSVVEDKSVKDGITRLEAKVLKEADFRMAVSSKLVSYWKEIYGYDSDEHAVIPCTLNSSFTAALPDSATLERCKIALGFNSDDVILTYSGSSAGWQSFSMVDEFLTQLIGANPKLKVLFLSPSLPEGLVSSRYFPGRILNKWVKPAEVSALLAVCDYGLIIRERSVTNRVSSPVKFAEYLSCGLSILISAEIGDYSEFVSANSCGTIIHDIRTPLVLHPISRALKMQYHALALKEFSKASFKTSYQQIAR